MIIDSRDWPPSSTRITDWQTTATIKIWTVCIDYVFCLGGSEIRTQTHTHIKQTNKQKKKLISVKDQLLSSSDSDIVKPAKFNTEQVK